MFDFNYYLNKYPDLSINGIKTKQQALRHWNIFGKKEGRICNGLFDYIIDYKDKIFDIKYNVENTDIYYNHYEIKNSVIDDNTITIVMTSSNRSKQTYFTLDSISSSIIKNIQVIIVDDSDVDQLDEECLKKYPFYIDFLKINKKNKDWYNPAVNYNIGFKFIKGNYIIIQNAEVCHIGDICKYIIDNVIDNNYYVFDVKASLNFDTNNEIYNSDISNISIFNNNLFFMWYQSKSNNRKYHFLSCMTKKTFDNIKTFSYDYSLGNSYDDDDFILKIVSKNINIINVFHDIYNIGGIHLFHSVAENNNKISAPLNKDLFDIKNHIFKSKNTYIDLTENKYEFDKKCSEFLFI